MADAQTRSLLNNLPEPAPGKCHIRADGTKVCHHQHKMPNAPNAVTVHTYRQGRPGQHFDVFTPVPDAAPAATCESRSDPEPAAAWAPSSSFIGPETTSTGGHCGTCQHNRNY